MIRSLAFVLLASCFVPSTVAAQALPESVVLDVEACDGATFDALSVIEQVRVELASDGIEDVHAAPPGSELRDAMAHIRVAVPCGEERAFLVHIDDLLTQKSVERAFVLTGLDDAAVLRALSLGIAELLRASWAELELAEPTSDASPAIIEALRVRVRGLREARALGAPAEPVVEADAPEEPALEEPSVRAARPSLGFAFVVRAFPSGSAAPLGARVVLEVPLAPLLVLSLDGEAVFGTSLHPLGTIELGLATGGLALSAVAALDALRVSLGARAAAGAAWASGRPADAATTGSSGLGFVLLLGAKLEIAVRVAEVVELRFGVEAGGAPVGFEARVGTAPVAGAVGGSLAGWGGLAFVL